MKELCFKEDFKKSFSAFYPKPPFRISSFFFLLNFFYFSETMYYPPCLPPKKLLSTLATHHFAK